MVLKLDEAFFFCVCVGVWESRHGCRTIGPFQAAQQGEKLDEPWQRDRNPF